MDWLCPPATLKLMEIMLILERMWISPYLWYWPKVKPIRMQICGNVKWLRMERGEQRGVPCSSEGSARRSVTLQLDALPLGVSIISCAEPCVMQCVAGGDCVCCLCCALCLPLKCQYHKKMFVFVMITYPIRHIINCSHVITVCFIVFISWSFREGFTDELSE